MIFLQDNESTNVWLDTNFVSAETSLLCAGATASDAVAQLIPAATMTRVMDNTHTPADASDLNSRRSLMQTNAATSSCTHPAIRTMVKLVNKLRVSVGVAPLTCVDSSSKVAWKWSDEMCKYASNACAVICLKKFSFQLY